MFAWHRQDAAGCRIVACMHRDRWPHADGQVERDPIRAQNASARHAARPRTYRIRPSPCRSSRASSRHRQRWRPWTKSGRNRARRTGEGPSHTSRTIPVSTGLARWHRPRDERHVVPGDDHPHVRPDVAVALGFLRDPLGLRGGEHHRIALWRLVRVERRPARPQQASPGRGESEVPGQLRRALRADRLRPGKRSPLSRRPISVSHGFAASHRPMRTDRARQRSQR